MIVGFSRRGALIPSPSGEGDSKYGRVILLAEAGAGKTKEMEVQVKRLVEEAQFAFFLPLESLDRTPVIDLFSAADESNFEAWKRDGDAPAWFFLDAVDELKLTKGKLDRSLHFFSKAINGHLGRARVIISCRPSDWRPSLDMTTVRNKLPVPARGDDNVLSDGDEVFIGALRRDVQDTSTATPEARDVADQNAFRTVAMLPMNDTQIKLFAEQSTVNDAAAFLAEIAGQNAWTFARRPLDLTELIATWTSSGRLGTRAEQHETNVTTRLSDDPDRPDHGVLTDVQLRRGAERLALGLAVTRTRNIRSPEQALDIDRTDGVLDAASILRDWTDAQRQVLLRRALFDPATYGRVRFYHRSVQEYLAAKQLLTLHEQGMSTKALFRLLFAERYGVEVVRPSMRAVAAWLALWNDPVRRELIKREPVALLTLGDPETLDLPDRGNLVRACVAAYGHGGWLRLDIPEDEVRRLADPALAPVIRECWGDGPVNDDVRELLVTMIWLGPVDSCADLALAAARDTTWCPYGRIIAIRALLACGQKVSVRELADDILASHAFWPDRVVHGVAADLFPKIITAEELITLMERTREPKQSVGGFGWVTRRIVETIEPWSEAAVGLRDEMKSLIWRGRELTQKSYHICGRFNHLAPALAILCYRQLSEAAKQLDADLIHACVIASRFGENESSRHDTVAKLKEYFEMDAALRNESFWVELAFMDQVAPVNDDWHRFYQTAEYGLVSHPTEADRPWLETALADESRPERRAVSLHALIQLWYRRGRIVGELNAIRANLKGDSVLEQILAERTAPPEQAESLERMERKRRRRQTMEARREAERLEKWRKWRDELLADPASAFSEEKRAATLSDIYSWLTANCGERNRYNIWDKGALERGFSPDIAARVEKAFKTLWRTTRPVLWSARPVEERNRTPRVWIYGLLGVSAEAATPGWAGSLSPDEARIAAAYATIELNGLAPFITDVAESHPAEVEEVIGSELSAELSVGSDHDYLPTLQDLTYAAGSLKQLFVPRLLAELEFWPQAWTSDTAQRWARQLGQVLDILGEANDEADRNAITQECANRYESDPAGALACVWLRGLVRCDGVRGTRALMAGLADANDPGVRSRAIEIFAEVFGRDGVVFDIKDPVQRAYAFGQLVRCAYTFIRPEDDVVHEGVYSPSKRDDAEAARSFLLSRLLDTPGPVARGVVLELAADPSFANVSDYLRLRAEQRTAADAEFETPFEPEEVNALSARLEAPAQDRDDLFVVIMDRLDDLARDLAHHDFTDRRTVRSISDESEMQRTLAWRIADKANGAYLVTREDEVADRKRTDIRLLSVKGGQRAVVEVKIADKRWTLTDFQRALRNQLVGQYLRHRNCKAGCLLLTDHGRRTYWVHPDTRKHLKFLEMVEFLNNEARALEIETMHDVRVAVFGLDLSDPPLAGAHRGS